MAEPALWKVLAAHSVLLLLAVTVLWIAATVLWAVLMWPFMVWRILRPRGWRKYRNEDFKLAVTVSDGLVVRIAEDWQAGKLVLDGEARLGPLLAQKIADDISRRGQRFVAASWLGPLLADRLAEDLQARNLRLGDVDRLGPRLAGQIAEDLARRGLVLGDVDRMAPQLVERIAKDLKAGGLVLVNVERLAAGLAPRLAGQIVKRWVEDGSVDVERLAPRLAGQIAEGLESRDLEADDVARLGSLLVVRFRLLPVELWAGSKIGLGVAEVVLWWRKVRGGRYG